MNTNSPLISILMSVYNEERYLRKAIESILNQSFTDFEFIIVNDGSVDDSLRILQEYQARDRRVCIINQKNTGLAESLNTAFNQSSGQYIARMDADDISLPNRLEIQLKFLELNPHVHLVGSQYIEIDENDEQTNLESSKPLLHNHIVQQFPFVSPIVHPTFFMRREVMTTLSGYRNFRAAEDYDFLLRAIEHDFILANLPEKLFMYRHNKRGISLSNKKQQHINAQIAYKLYLQRIRGIKESPRYTKKVSAYRKKSQLYSVFFNIIRIRHRQIINTTNICIKIKNYFIIILCLLLNFQLGLTVIRYIVFVWSAKRTQKNSLKNSHKNICVIASIAWTVNNFCFEIIKSLFEQGYAITILVIDPHALHSYFKKYLDVQSISISPISVNPFVEFYSCISMYQRIRQIKPDIILTYTIKPNIIACMVGKLLSIPVIPNITGLGRVKLNAGILYRLVFMLYMAAMRFATWVFFQNKNNAHVFFGGKGTNYTILPGLGINELKFLPKKRTDKGLFFILVSRMLYSKGIREFIEASKIIVKRQNCNFVLLGATDEIDSISFSQSELEKCLLGSPVKYYGFIQDVREYLQTPACFVLPSYYPEGMPQSLLEAASMELAIITTDTPGCREIVEEGKNGFLVKPQSVEDLAEAMQKIINLSSEELQSFCKRSREIVLEKFTVQKIIDEYSFRIHKICNRA